jgi:hypothetical protein
LKNSESEKEEADSKYDDEEYEVISIFFEIFF